jgi:hypothetical protein
MFSAPVTDSAKSGKVPPQRSAVRGQKRPSARPSLARPSTVPAAATGRAESALQRCASGECDCAAGKEYARLPVQARPSGVAPRPVPMAASFGRYRLQRSVESFGGTGSPLTPGLVSAWAIQRDADTTPVSPTGDDVSALAIPSGQASGTDNAEDPDASLTAIENGAPFAAEAPGPPLDGDQPVAQAAGRSTSRGITPPGPGAVLARLGPGRALEAPLRKHFGGVLGHDFSRVRVHTDARADELSAALAAHAFTIGEHISFASGRYNPASTAGQRLIVHELAHVVQQRRGLSAAMLRDGIGRVGDAYEREAESVADRAVAMRATAETAVAPVPSWTPREIALQLYSGSAAASYATKWATSINPAYGKLGDDDCTNFVSQAMEAGGWAYVWGTDVCDERKSCSVWWFERDKCKRWPRSTIHASNTWGGAENFYCFLDASSRGTRPTRVSDLEVGDVLQRDHGDGTIHHTMIVTEKGNEVVDGAYIIQLKLSYHTKDTLNRPFWGKGNILDQTPAGWKYFAWKIT